MKKMHKQTLSPMVSIIEKNIRKGKLGSNFMKKKKNNHRKGLFVRLCYHQISFKTFDLCALLNTHKALGEVHEQ